MTATGSRPPEDSQEVAQPQSDQAEQYFAGGGLIGRLLRTVGASLRIWEVAELSLSTAGMTWLALTRIAAMSHGLAIVPAGLVGFVVARGLFRQIAKTTSEERLDGDQDHEKGEEAA